MERFINKVSNSLDVYNVKPIKAHFYGELWQADGVVPVWQELCFRIWFYTIASQSIPLAQEMKDNDPSVKKFQMNNVEQMYC